MGSECLCGHYRLVNCRLTNRGTGPGGLVANAECLGIRNVLPFRGLMTSCMGGAKGRILCEIAPVFSNDGLITGNILVRTGSIRSGNNNVLFGICYCGIRPKIKVGCRGNSD